MEANIFAELGEKIKTKGDLYDIMTMQRKLNIYKKLNIYTQT